MMTLIISLTSNTIQCLRPSVLVGPPTVSVPCSFLMSLELPKVPYEGNETLQKVIRRENINSSINSNIPNKTPV